MGDLRRERIVSHEGIYIIWKSGTKARDRPTMGYVSRDHLRGGAFSRQRQQYDL